jgi:hypothetical protein
LQRIVAENFGINDSPIDLVIEIQPKDILGNELVRETGLGRDGLVRLILASIAD